MAPSPLSSLTPVEKMRVALRLMDAGIRLKRAHLQRMNPTASEAEIDAALRSWLRDRPPDADGVPSKRFDHLKQ